MDPEGVIRIDAGWESGDTRELRSIAHFVAVPKRNWGIDPRGLGSASRWGHALRDIQQAKFVAILRVGQQGDFLFTTRDVILRHADADRVSDGLRSDDLDADLRRGRVAYFIGRSVGTTRPNPADTTRSNPEDDAGWGHSGIGNGRRCKGAARTVVSVNVARGGGMNGSGRM